MRKYERTAPVVHLSQLLRCVVEQIGLPRRIRLHERKTANRMWIPAGLNGDVPQVFIECYHMPKERPVAMVVIEMANDISTIFSKRNIHLDD